MGDVAAGLGFTRNSFTKVIDDDEMKFRSRGIRGISALLVVVHAVKHFNEIQDANYQAGLFAQFTGNALLQGLTELQHSTRNGPLAAQGFAAATNEKGAAVDDDDATDANYRTIRIFSGHELAFAATEAPGKQDSNSGSIERPTSVYNNCTG